VRIAGLSSSVRCAPAAPGRSPARAGQGPTFGELLRRHRLAAGQPQAELAEHAGLSARAISDLERGINRTPRKDTLKLLGDALQLPPHDRAILEGTVARRRSPPAAQPPAALPPLPAPSSPLVGGERGLETIRQQLLPPEVRLLTLTGPGGIGKSRRALQVAADLVKEFADGVCFVSLGSLQDARLVAVTIAQELEAGDAGGEGHRNPPSGSSRAKAHRSSFMVNGCRIRWHTGQGGGDGSPGRRSRNTGQSAQPGQTVSGTIRCSNARKRPSMLLIPFVPSPGPRPR